ncbi:MAG TPA: ribosomal protein S5-alanine N-acetyltransferase [Blastocatellia bacterium]|nr:ribosomal protein S5-alanine N-acetyltransferase [Blastocatellia bacterium]
MTLVQIEIPSILTERLILTLPGENDAARMARYATENREHLAPWESLRDDEYFMEANWVSQIELWRNEFSEGRSLRLALLDRFEPESDILGHCGFSNIVRGPFHACYLGYSLDHRAVGKGLMFEALTAGIDYAFKTLKLHRIMANYMPSNARSGKLLRRLGFVVEGYARDYLKIAGRWEDHIMTSLTTPEW